MSFARKFRKMFRHPVGAYPTVVLAHLDISRSVGDRDVYTLTRLDVARPPSGSHQGVVRCALCADSVRVDVKSEAATRRRLAVWRTVAWICVAAFVSFAVWLFHGLFFIPEDERPDFQLLWAFGWLPLLYLVFLSTLFLDEHDGVRLVDSTAHDLKVVEHASASEAPTSPGRRQPSTGPHGNPGSASAPTGHTGHRSPPPPGERGADALIRLSFGLLECATGVTKPVTVDTAVLCEQCAGTTGSGCPRCGGARRVRIRRDIQARIPAGVSHGQRVRLAGMGEVGIGGGPAGDVYIEIDEQPHTVFTRDGANIHRWLSLSASGVYNGRNVGVETLLDGFVPILIPHAAQPGATTVLQGLGIPHLNSTTRGDLYIHLTP